MGRLENNRTGQSVPLAAEHLVGRSPGCVLRIDAEPVSREHARLTWSPAGTWEIRDLGSKNGTFAEGERLGPGTSAVLLAGSTVAFGDPNDTWTLVDAEPPAAMALDLADGRIVEGDGGLIALPSEDDPAVTIFEAATGQWQQQRSNEAAQGLEDGSVVVAGMRSFRIHLPGDAVGTPHVSVQPVLTELSLTFRVSQDEETIDISARHTHGVITLRSREHSYLLLLLARARMKDADEPPAEQGWIDRDELLRMLRVDVATLDMLVHRARRQLAKEGVRGATGLVEVRRGSRRIGVADVTIGSL